MAISKYQKIMQTVAEEIKLQGIDNTVVCTNDESLARHIGMVFGVKTRVIEIDTKNDYEKELSGKFVKDEMSLYADDMIHQFPQVRDFLERVSRAIPLRYGEKGNN